MIFRDLVSPLISRVLEVFQLGSLTLMICGAGFSQSLVGPDELANVQKAFETASTSKLLRCEITPIRPALDFSLRFQTGYRINVPFSQFRGPGHKVTVFTRVTPDGGQPSFLVRTENLPDVPDTKLEAEITGKFIASEGLYRVEALLEDDLHRVCRNNWRIQVKPSGSERDLKPTMPPERVKEIGSQMPAQPERNAGGRIERLSLMVHAAPLSPRLSTLQGDDVLRLVGSLSSLLDQLPAAAVRLTVFNLDQRVVLFRKDDFSAKDIEAVTTAVNQLQLALVDYKALLQRGSPVSFLSDLIHTELADQKPLDALILVGPQGRLLEGSLPPAVERPAATAPTMFYVQHRLPKPPGVSMGRGSNTMGSRRSSTGESPYPPIDDASGALS